MSPKPTGGPSRKIMQFYNSRRIQLSHRTCPRMPEGTLAPRTSHARIPKDCWRRKGWGQASEGWKKLTIRIPETVTINPLPFGCIYRMTHLHLSHMRSWMRDPLNLEILQRCPNGPWKTILSCPWWADTVEPWRMMGAFLPQSQNHEITDHGTFPQESSL